MKRMVYLLIAGTVFSLSACKSSQSAYQQAYEKAVSGDEAKAVIEEPVAQSEAPVAEDVSNVSVREEKVSVVSGDSDIKAYGIVCGSLRPMPMHSGNVLSMTVTRLSWWSMRPARLIVWCSPALTLRMRLWQNVTDSRQDILTIRISRAPGSFTENSIGTDSGH